MEGSERRSNPHIQHLSMAERGKEAALEGQHGRALEWYRQALHLARTVGAPPLFARHYADCIFESLERSGQYRPALELCEAACADMERAESPTPLQARDHATMLLRRAVLLVRLQRSEEAAPMLEEAIERARPSRLPLAEELLEWRRRAFSVSPQRLTEAQERHGFFHVRRDALRPDLARLAPETPSSPGPPPGPAHP